MRLPLLRRTVPALALAVLLAPGLSACGGTQAPAGAHTSTSPSITPRPSVPPATGRLVKGTGYTFRTLPGWTDTTKAARGTNKLVQVAAAAQPDASGFATGVNVVVSDSGVTHPSADQLQEASQTIRKELLRIAPKLRINAETLVAGEPALDHEGAAVRKGVHYYIHQFVAFRDGKAYTITFIFGRTVSGTQRTRVIEPILASWKWTS